MPDPYLGEIKLVSFNFAPSGWALCNGQLLAISQNQALFSILGTTYGGNGTTTFALPALQGRIPVHVGSGILLGQSGGESTHAMTVSELPAHGHAVSGNSGSPTLNSPTNAVWANQLSNGYSPTCNASMNPLAIAPTGGGLGHENMSPYLVLNFIIALVGIFPSRT